MFPITNDIFNSAMERVGIIDIKSATIRQICALAAELERIADEKMVHLEIGNPGLNAESIGIDSEIKALQGGVANKYPAIEGIPELKDAGEKFIKAFLNVEMPGKCIIPTVGSMQGSFTLMLILAQRLKGKDTILFINPGFPANRCQAKLLNIKEESFDIYEYRGEKLREKLESILSKGNITAILYSNPNNPAWTNMTDEELRIIGECATKYDAVVMEDLAYMGMDFRSDFSHPGEAPFIPSVANYTDNYILLLSGSKIFSYAGQRIAIVAISPKLFNQKYEFFEKFYEMPKFGDAYIYGVLYCCSSGTAHSAQFALASMMDAAAKGELNFVEHCRDYAKRAERTKKLFLDNGFHIVYSKDGDQLISDGFFFTIGYGNMSADEINIELLKHGVASIALPSTGSEQSGVRVCVSLLNDEDCFERLERFLRKFNEEHKSKK